MTNDIISDQEFNLAASDKLAVMAMPMTYTQEADGELSFHFEEAHLTSPIAIEYSAYNTPLAASNGIINIRYQLINTSTNQMDNYEVRVPISVAINNPDDLQAEIHNQLITGDLDIYLNDSQINSMNDGTPIPITDLLVSLQPVTGTTTTNFEFNPNTSDESFMTKLELHISGTNPSDANILTNMLGGQTNENNWHYQVDMDLMITSGAWEVSSDGDGNPILVMNDTYTESIPSEDGTFSDVTLNRDEIVKPYTHAEVTDSLFKFASCGNDGRVCSIQVLKDQVAMIR